LFSPSILLFFHVEYHRNVFVRLITDQKKWHKISVAGFTTRSLISLGDHVGMSIHRINSMRIMRLIGIWQNTDCAMTVKKMRI